jgi:hypothetical protein
MQRAISRTPLTPWHGNAVTWFWQYDTNSPLGKGSPMLDRLNDLQAKVDAEKAAVASGEGDYQGATRAGLGIGNILDIVSEVIAIVKGIFTHEPPTPPTA